MELELWVLTCAPNSRRDEALHMFESMEVPIGRRVIVTTEPDPIRDFPGYLLHYPGTDINISKWWTIGLDYIAQHYDVGNKWDVLLMETDAYISPPHVQLLREYMRTSNCVMAGPDWDNILAHEPSIVQVRRDNYVRRPAGRCIGYGQLVAGETGIRHDPEFRWWLADDDFEWQHRVHGGAILVNGLDAHHRGTQGPLTGERLQAWEEDQVKFVEKWGGSPATGGIVE